MQIIKQSLSLREQMGNVLLNPKNVLANDMQTPKNIKWRITLEQIFWIPLKFVRFFNYFFNKVNVEQTQKYHKYTPIPKLTYCSA